MQEQKTVTENLKDSQTIALRGIEINPIIYMAKLFALKKSDKNGFTKEQLEDGLKDWLDQHHKDPGLMEKLRRIGPPLKFAVAYLKAKEKKSSRIFSTIDEEVSALLLEASAITGDEDDSLDTFEDDLALDDLDDLIHSSETAEIEEADIPLVQEKLFQYAEKSQPIEAVALLVLIQAVTHNLALAIKGALLLLKKHRYSTEKGKRFCLKGVRSLLEKEQMRHVDDDLDELIVEEKDPESKAELIALKGWASSKTPEKIADPSKDKVEQTKQKFDDNKQDATQEPDKDMPEPDQPETGQHQSVKAKKPPSPFDVPMHLVPTASFMSTADKKSDD